MVDFLSKFSDLLLCTIFFIVFYGYSRVFGNNQKSGDKKWTFENFSKIELLIVFCENLVAKSGLLRKFQ